MVTDDDDTCTSKAPQESSTNSRQQRRKLEVYNDVLQKLKDSHHPDAQLPAFDDQLWAHFNRLPLRYALDVNVDTPEDVLAHKRLLHLAQDPANRPALEVRLVQVPNISDGNSASSSNPNSPLKEVVRSIHPPPAFGSSPNLEALALESSKSHNEEGEIIENNDVRVSRLSYWRYCRPLHEITYSTDDRQKLLCQLSSLLSEIGLNIQEAHAFSTSDGYSLNVFVVDGWPYEEIELLRSAIEKGLLDIEQYRPNQLSSFTLGGYEKVEIKCELDQLAIPSDGTDVWEIEPQHVKFGSKIASGSYGDLFKGVYYGQEVAIKILKADRLKTELLKEFAQEVYIMRKVRHKNVVQFIGACTKPPNLCIVTEFMSGGSVYDYLHKQKGVFKLPILLKVAIDISKGMDYLHQNNIIHRDLKTANLLLDENDVVKVADFGVARVRAQTGVMTAETGTYRWMAPEVTEHKPYDHKADVFSFGILLWELLTAKIPYEYLTPIQAAIAVVQKDLRPTIPKHTHPKLGELIEKCWLKDSTLRPNFGEIIGILQQISKEVGDEGDDRKKDKRGGFFNSLRRGHY